MNVHVRLFAGSALASLAALALAGTPLAAQSAQFGSDTLPSAIAAVGVARAAFVAPLGSVPRDSASPTTTQGSASVTAVRGPSTSSARVAAQTISTSNGAPVFQDKKPKRSVAFMVVGGAALVVGAVIGDDAGTIVMLGGAAIGLYGLYRFLT
jgi:hypothetical protein